MAADTILVVEDELDILELISYHMESEGYRIIQTTSGEHGLKMAQKEHPDLILLDLMLPGIDGLEVCRRLKREENTREIPIMMLTAKTQELDQITGLESGADDYLTKPFSPNILAARVKAVLRRRNSEEKKEIPTIMEVHDIIIDTARHEVKADGELVSLSATEFGILRYLAENPGWVFSRNQIIDAVKGSDYPVTERSVDVQILGLRKKLGDQGRHIETVRGFGYRLRSE
jgi:two-component system alkaline phosphatase synthesis response regulator PhoP